MFKQICIVCFFIHAASLHLDHDNSRALNNAANLQKIRDTIVAAGERMISASPTTSADGEIIKRLVDMKSLLEKPEMMGQLGENRGSFRPLAESSDAPLQRSFLADPVAVGLRDDILKKLSANDQARKRWTQNLTLEPASFLSLMENTKQEFAPLKKDIISLFQRISTITSSASGGCNDMYRGVLAVCTKLDGLDSPAAKKDSKEKKCADAFKECPECGKAYKFCAKLKEPTSPEGGATEKDCREVYARCSPNMQSYPPGVPWGLPGPPGFSFNLLFPGPSGGTGWSMEVRIRPNANWKINKTINKVEFNVESKYRAAYNWANGLKLFVTGYDESAWFKGGPGFFLPSSFPKGPSSETFFGFKFQLYLETRFTFPLVPGVKLIPALDYGWNWWANNAKTNNAFFAQWTVLDVKRDGTHFQVAPVFVWDASREGLPLIGWGLEGLGFYREGGKLGAYPPATFLGRFIDFMCKIIFGPNTKCPDSTDSTKLSGKAKTVTLVNLKEKYKVKVEKVQVDPSESSESTAVLETTGSGEEGDGLGEEENKPGGEKSKPEGEESRSEGGEGKSGEEEIRSESIGLMMDDGSTEGNPVEEGDSDNGLATASTEEVKNADPLPLPVEKAKVKGPPSKVVGKVKATGSGGAGGEEGKVAVKVKPAKKKVKVAKSGGAGGEEGKVAVKVKPAKTSVEKRQQDAEKQFKERLAAGRDMKAAPPIPPMTRS